MDKRRRLDMEEEKHHSSKNSKKEDPNDDGSLFFQAGVGLGEEFGIIPALVGGFLGFLLDAHFASTEA